MNRIIENTVEAVRSDPKKAVMGGVALVVLVVGLVLIARSLFGGTRPGSVSGSDQAAAAAGDATAPNPAYETKMDPQRGQRQGNRFLAPTGGK